MQESIIWVGLDVHKDSITAAMFTDDSDKGEIIRLTGEVKSVRRLFRRLEKRGAIRSCYEASSCGYSLCRALQRDGFHCEVIAPCLIPRIPGNRHKTDRIDASNLAKLLRSGHLTTVRVPDESQEAVRGLVRLRYSCSERVKATKQRICSFTLRDGLVFRETKTYWTRKHRCWLRDLHQSLSPPQSTTLGIELNHLEYLETQLRSLDLEIDRYAQRDPYRETVDALCCLKGVRTLTAMILATEIGDVSRFPSARSLMAWTGLVPRERSSGNREWRGWITKCGNRHVRRILVESAWNHTRGRRATAEIRRRRMGKDPVVVGIAVRAQHRLQRRVMALGLRKHQNVAVTAVAREMAGFVWAIMRAVPQTV